MVNPAMSSQCVDSDGDGWGWDGFNTCLIGEDAANTIDVSECIDTDGDGWSWDGVNSCLIDAASANSSGGTVAEPAECVDSDGDGYGWDGIGTCFIENEEITNSDDVGNALDFFTFPLQGTITRVIDGDSIDMFVAGVGSTQVRLLGIDAPEYDQEFGAESENALSWFMWSFVDAHCTGVDVFGRYLCEIFVDDLNLNLWQVEHGRAWWYERFQEQQSPAARVLYSVAEASARRFGLGLWASPNPIAPWDWRAR